VNGQFVPSSETLLTWGTGGLSVGAGLYAARMLGRGVSWLIVFFIGRSDAREARIDAEKDELAGDWKDEISRLKGECAELRDRADLSERKWRECEERDALRYKDLMRLEGLMQAKGEIKNAIQTGMAAEKLLGDGGKK
jgi:hypothetical protein